MASEQEPNAFASLLACVSCRISRSIMGSVVTLADAGPLFDGPRGIAVLAQQYFRRPCTRSHSQERSPLHCIVSSELYVVPLCTEGVTRHAPLDR